MQPSLPRRPGVVGDSMPRRRPINLSLAECLTLSRVTVGSFDASALRWAASFTGNAVQSALDAEDIFKVKVPPWAEARKALESHFALGKASHCLSVLPHVWADFHEPQITVGFVHFLTIGVHQNERVLALLRATGFSERDLQLSQIVRTAAVAEARTGDGERIDILAYADTGRGRYGVVVEAKFDAHLLEKQLRIYQKAAKDIYRLASSQRRRLVVVAPKFSRKIGPPLQNYPEWQFVTWERLLVRFEAWLPPESDCEEFSRFRRTIWHRAGYG